jgi:O-antigen/teichoic acid export membrane protein
MPLALGLNLVIGLVLGFRGESLAAILLAAMGMAIGSLASLWISALFAIERFHIYLKLVVAVRASGLVLMILSLKMLPSVITVISVVLLANLAFGIAGFTIVQRMFGRIRPRWDFLVARKLMIEAFPVTWASVMATIGLRADSVMIERLRGANEAGIYSGAYSIYMFGAVLVYAASVATFPRFAQASNPDNVVPGQFKALFFYSAPRIAALGIAGTFVGMFAGPLAVKLFYGLPFADSQNPLRVLVLALPFIGLNRLGYQAMNASNHQNKTFIATAIGALFNVVANLLLIPRWSYIAASWTTVATEVLMSGLFAWFVISVMHHQSSAGESTLLGEDKHDGAQAFDKI